MVLVQGGMTGDPGLGITKRCHPHNKTVLKHILVQGFHLSSLGSRVNQWDKEQKQSRHHFS